MRDLRVTLKTEGHVMVYVTFCFVKQFLDSSLMNNDSA